MQLENFSAWHNVPFGTKQNGFGGLDTKFEFNGKLQKRHIENMAEVGEVRRLQVRRPPVGRKADVLLG